MEKILLEAIESLAPSLNELTIDENAQFFYDIISSSIIWTDEKPNRNLSQIELSVFRRILRHRTIIILKINDDKYKVFWDKATFLCYQWPGLTPSRRSPEVAVLYRKIKGSRLK